MGRNQDEFESFQCLFDFEVDGNRDGYHFFVMQDPLSVDQAVEQGATRLEDTDLVL